MKNFFNEIEAVGRIDWDGMASQPIEYVALAVKQSLSALSGLEESVYHARMRVLRVARQFEVWKLDLDPELDQPFMTMRRWIQAFWPKSYRYCLDAWETEEALEAVPMADLAEITGANLKVLKDVSSNVRGKKAVLKAAKEMTAERFKEHLTEKYDQHLQKLGVMPKDDIDEFETAIEMAKIVEECPTRAAAIKAIAVSYIQDHAVEFEHKREETA